LHVHHLREGGIRAVKKWLLQFLKRRGLASRTWKKVAGRRVYGWRVGLAGWFRERRPRNAADPNQRELFEAPK
jgi:hypothetical protein